MYNEKDSREEKAVRSQMREEESRAAKSGCGLTETPSFASIRNKKRAKKFRRGLLRSFFIPRLPGVYAIPDRKLLRKVGDTDRKLRRTDSITRTMAPPDR